MGYAEKMQRLCARRAIDQATLAERMGLSRSSVSRILSGVQEPKLGLAFELARALDVSLDYLADDAVEGEPTGHSVTLSDDELTVLKIVRRLGADASIDRLLGVAAAPNGTIRPAQDSMTPGISKLSSSVENESSAKNRR